MAAARIAAVSLAAILPLAGAQQSPQAQLTIQVSDPIGAVIPGARIQLEPAPPGIDPELKTNWRGQATINLQLAKYSLSISAPGFKKWIQPIEVREATSRAITATLEIGKTEGPCTMACYVPRDLPLERPDPVFLCAQLLSILAPLPSHPAKKRRFR
jgi:hypothetical protein